MVGLYPFPNNRYSGFTDLFFVVCNRPYVYQNELQHALGPSIEYYTSVYFGETKNSSYLGQKLPVVAFRPHWGYHNTLVVQVSDFLPLDHFYSANIGL